MSELSSKFEQGQGSARPTILLVEDGEMLRLVMRRALEMANFGIQILESAGAQEALELASRHKVDVAIGDGGLDRLHFLEVFKAEHPAVPVIFTSSGWENQTVYGLGAFRYLPKPFTLQELRQTAEMALRSVGYASPGSNRSWGQGAVSLPWAGEQGVSQMFSGVQL